MKPIDRRTNEEIAVEWDKISNTRFKQIDSKKDISFHYILEPCINSLIKPSNRENVLDIGCGTGNLTNSLSDQCNRIIGIDQSGESIDVAKRYFETEKIKFHHSTIEDYTSAEPFSLVIANMVLMDVPDLSNVIKSVKKLLGKNGHFIFTIIHPCYWSIYKDYFYENWFYYKNEIFIESEFNITLEEGELHTTHIHRPLEQYINSLSKEGFIIEEMVEPVATKINAMSFPKFMGIRCRL